MKSKILAASAAIMGALLGSPAIAQSTTEAGLDGQYASIACEIRPQPNQDGSMGEWWLTRDITITENRIDAIFTTYASAGCEIALQELHFGGGIEIVGPSEVIEGAVEANLTIDDYVRIMPLAEDFAEFLNSAPTGACLSAEWTVGEARDILQDGCLVLGVQPNTPTVEYEILATRPTDGTFIVSPDVRPSALLVGAARR